MIQFIYGNPQGGPLVSGRVEEWDWSRRGGDYKNHRDFFTIHWEIQTSKPNEVRFHVESPVVEVDHKLNDIKNDIVSRFIRDDIREAIFSAGFDYKIGSRISEKCIRLYKSTEPFRIILPKHFEMSSFEKNIEYIHEIFSRTINSALEPYLIKIKEEFGEL
jgi:hypothetical protein